MLLCVTCTGYVIISMRFVAAKCDTRGLHAASWDLWAGRMRLFGGRVRKKSG